MVPRRSPECLLSDATEALRSGRRGVQVYINGSGNDRAGGPEAHVTTERLAGSTPHMHQRRLATALPFTLLAAPARNYTRPALNLVDERQEVTGSSHTVQTPSTPHYLSLQKELQRYFHPSHTAHTSYLSLQPSAISWSSCSACSAPSLTLFTPAWYTFQFLTPTRRHCSRGRRHGPLTQRALQHKIPDAGRTRRERRGSSGTSCCCCCCGRHCSSSGSTRCRLLAGSGRGRGPGGVHLRAGRRGGEGDGQLEREGSVHLTGAWTGGGGGGGQGGGREGMMREGI